MLDASITIRLNTGRSSLTMREYQLPSEEAYAAAAVIDQVIAQVMRNWPRFVYRDQIRKLVDSACSIRIEGDEFW